MCVVCVRCNYKDVGIKQEDWERAVAEALGEAGPGVTVVFTYPLGLRAVTASACSWPGQVSEPGWVDTQGMIVE